MGSGDGSISDAQASLGGKRIIAPDLVKRELRRAFIGFFSLCLVVPLLQTLYPVLSIVDPVEERRAPSPFPSLRLLLGEDGEFAAQLNKWFGDRAGLRDLFIRLKNQIDYSIFHQSRKVYIGSDGWLFLRSDVPRDFDAGTLAALEECFLTLARRFRERGIQLLVVGYPDKSTVYPEMAPPDMPLKPAGSNYDRFRQFLATRPELIFVDVQEIMQHNKAVTDRDPEATLYYKTDLHPTVLGQIPVVKEVIARIARAEGRSDIRWDSAFTIGKGYWSGAEGRFLSVLFSPKEEPPMLLDGYDVGGSAPDGQWVLPDRSVFERADEGIGRPFDAEFRSRPELCRQRLPGVMLFGNSASDAWWPLGFQSYFCFSRRARDPMSRFKLFYETMPADTKYFIYQYDETHLTAILESSWFSSDALQ